MGLKSYRAYKKRQELLSLLKSEFGVSEQDLINIKEIANLSADFRKYKERAEEDINMLKEQNRAYAEENKSLKERIETLEKVQVKVVELTEKQKKEIAQKYQGATTPEDIVKMFAEDAEEFYPNGIGN